MADEHRVPWFPAWGIQFSEPLDDPRTIVGVFNEWRPSERWLLMAFDAAASEIHLWTAWHSLRRRELRKEMVGNNVDTEFLRLISGTHQIKTAFERAGLRSGDQSAWIVHLPDFGGLDPYDSAANEVVEIPRESFNDATLEAQRLMLHLKSELIPRRPLPTQDGLDRLGYTTSEEGSNPSNLESYFLVHAAMADLHN